MKGNNRMTTSDVLLLIHEQGGFNNFRNWNEKEVADWVKANYDCSAYVAKRVARSIK